MSSMARWRVWVVVVAAAGLVAVSPGAWALPLSEDFETASPTAKLGALYPGLTFTSVTQWTVSGGQARVAQGSTCLATTNIDPFDPGGYVVEGDCGIPLGSSAGSYNLGMRFGGNDFVFHPGYTPIPGAFRIGGISSTNRDMGFVPPMGVGHTMQIQSSGTDQYRVTVTDPTDPISNAYALTITDPSPTSSPQSVGFILSASQPTYQGFFDNLRVSKPHLRLNANNPTDGGRTDGVSVWAGSGGTQSDAALVHAPVFQQGVDGSGEAVPAHAYQFNTSDRAVIADSPATHAENFVIDGWYKLDRLPGVSGSSSWQMFAENGDWYQGAEWAWLNSSDKRMYLYYSTGAGLGNNVTVSSPHGMDFLPDQFVHLAVAKEGSVVSMYVNGRSIGSSDTGQTAVADRSDVLTIGSWHRNGGWGGDWVNAQIGEFQFHNLDTDGRTGAQVVTEDYRGRYYDFHNHHPVRLDPNDPTDGGRTAGLANRWADSGTPGGGSNENDGVLHGPGGGPSLVVKAGWSNTYQFEAGDYARIADSASTHAESFLVEGWFQFDRVKDAGEGGSDVTLAECGDLFAGASDAATYGSEWYWLQTGGNQTLMVWDQSATGYGSAGQFSISAPLGFTEGGAFHHLAAAKDGDDLMLFVDGNLVSQVAMTLFTALKDGTAGISVGTFIRYGGSGGDPFEGQIGLFQIRDLDHLGMGLADYVRQSYLEGQPTFAPEPTTMLLLGGGILALLRRRRRA